MKICLSWLKDYLMFDFDTSLMMSKLTMQGIEIESYSKFTPSFEGVIFGVINSFKPHPSLDRLNICYVFDGIKEHQVVCGAGNVIKGATVAFAPKGAVLNNMKINSVDFNGILSEGMLCSEKELGIGFDSSGILIFDKGYENGKLIKEQLKLNDEIIEFGITPNRGDCLSVIGIAREIAASYGKEILIPKTEFNNSEKDKSKNEETSIDVKITDKTFCSYYGGAILDNVIVRKSDFTIRYRLFHSGIRSVNNIVDITNYILLELGQPMHAFDLDKLHGNKIIVRFASEGEELETLDGIKRKLSKENLVIADEKKAIALAGVMGGKETGITDSTKRIFFESAFFNPSNIRKTASFLNLASDSSYRFERGVDALMIPISLGMASKMTEKYAGGRVLNSNVNLENFIVPKRSIKIDLNRCNKILGTEIKDRQIDEYLRKIQICKKSECEYEVPTHRNDLHDEIDLIEEVARIYGYDNIPLNNESVEIHFEPNSEEFNARKKIKDFLISLELSEVINYSFCSPKELITIPTFIISKNVPVIKNPLSVEQSCMRNSLFSGLLKNFINSKNYNASDIKLFEIGAVFKSFDDLDENFECDTHLGIILGGKMSRKTLGEIERNFNLFDIKGIIEALLSAINIKYEFENFNNSFFIHGIKILCDKKVIGVFGEPLKEISENFGVKESVFYLELNLSIFKSNINQTIKYIPINRLPFIKEDMSFIIDNKITHDAILQCIKKLKIHEIEKVEIFDLYTGKNIPKGKKSVAYSITYRDTVKTLTTQEVNELHEKIKNNLQLQFNAEYR